MSTNANTEESVAGTVEATPQLKALIALLEDLSSVPNTHIRQLTIAYDSHFKRCDALSWPKWAPAHLYVLYVCMYV